MNGWKVTVIGVAATALVTALIVVGWTGGLRSAREQNIARPAPARVASNLTIPSRSDVSACNKYAASEVGMVEGGAIHVGGRGAAAGRAPAGSSAGAALDGTQLPPRLIANFRRDARAAVPWT